MKLTDSEKLILVMLSEIYEKLGIKNSVDPKFVKEAIYSGNAWGLKWEYPGIFGTGENSEEVLHEVMNWLDMWTSIERGFKDLSATDKARVKKDGADVRFRGFDGNNENEYGSVMRFLVNHLKKFSDFKERVDLDSHMPSIDIYRRMYDVYEPMRASLGDRYLGSELINFSALTIRS